MARRRQTSHQSWALHFRITSHANSGITRMAISGPYCYRLVDTSPYTVCVASGQRRTRYGLVSPWMRVREHEPDRRPENVEHRQSLETLCACSRPETNRHAVAGLCYGIMKHLSRQERLGQGPCKKR
ncbi:hypothetical protein CORC01_12051 [Colletotrichum orchidophilum]|uniref:Uncharacterized protein n=1 Tax=Colletotrichum orchidophilum TaxID=1209926 RepID=A0A1G4AU22_9PEZI|nr:uncharacterized protein CORC01_12051 [Colletotrichum orchidophilum]OHE92667.1 hypothetical protein CORC01_12051 [Colletotrichum orchidophilum]